MAEEFDFHPMWESLGMNLADHDMLLGAVLVLLGGVLWGINATVSKLLMADYHADPLWIACVRELAAGALFLACAGVRLSLIHI